MDILIIGGSGQLGKTLYNSLKKNYETIAFSKSELSITNETKIKSIITHHAPKIVINCSAYTKVDLAEENSDIAFDVNFNGIKNLCSACKSIQSTLIHFSTDYVYDGLKNEPYVETDSTHPINIYGASKLAGDEYIMEEMTNYFIFRVSGIFSEYGNNFVKTMMGLCSKNDLKIINDQTMKPSSASFIRDFININLNKRNFDASKSGLYNLASMGPSITWHGFAKLIFHEMINQDLTNNIPKLHPISSAEYGGKVDRPKFSVLCNDKLAKEFIIPTDSYTDYLKLELKEIYKHL